MRFCPDCDNIMIPKDGKLYCKACDKYFELGSDKKDYKIVKTIRHDDKETAPIVIKESMKSSRISLEDRKAYEEFFGNSEESGY
ncbi:MAG: hypothetical protein P8Y70_10765 [Candidatus Lokiarchaeota archaeon]